MRGYTFIKKHYDRGNNKTYERQNLHSDTSYRENNIERC